LHGFRRLNLKIYLGERGNMCIFLNVSNQLLKADSLKHEKQSASLQPISSWLAFPRILFDVKIQRSVLID